jgi:hypothetical protein
MASLLASISYGATICLSVPLSSTHRIMSQFEQIFDKWLRAEIYENGGSGRIGDWISINPYFNLIRIFSLQHGLLNFSH